MKITKDLQNSFLYMCKINVQQNTVVSRAGEPERGAMEPANFGGAGAGAFLNISAEPELEPQKFY